jgi:four helix bundle protein
MAKIERFEDLKTWQKARELNQRIYRASGAAAFARDYGLRDQIRRASISVMSNIAEGFERDGDKEFAQFLSNAKGSCGEARSQLYVALDENYLSHDEFEALREQCEEVSKMISGFMAYLRTSGLRGRKFKPGTKM